MLPLVVINDHAVLHGDVCKHPTSKSEGLPVEVSRFTGRLLTSNYVEVFVESSFGAIEDSQACIPMFLQSNNWIDVLVIFVG